MNPKSRQRWGEVAGSLAVLAALLALWWAASHQQWVSKVFLPTPESALASLPVLAPLTILGSNTIGNVPLVMLLTLMFWPLPTQRG